MGTSALMSLGVRAMFASFAQLQVTGHNIANAGVDGYSRQEAELASAKGQFTGAGFFGKGVDVVTVSRAHDAFLTREAANASALAAMDRTRYEQLARLEEVLPMGERGLGYAAQQFLNAMVDLASRPQDPSTREVVLARAGDLAARFNLAARQLDSLQAGVTQDLKHSVDTVNEIARSIAEVNQQIAMVKGLGQPPNDLLDRRDRLVQQLSGYLQVSTIPADDGTLGVFIAGGQRLVLGNQAQPLQVVPDPLDASRSALGIVEASGVRPLTADLLTGGSISGLLRFQNEDLAVTREAIDRMAAEFAGAVNAQHALGLDLYGDSGTASFFDYGGVVAGAAGAMRVAVADPRRVAAAAPLVAYAEPSNRGVAVVASLTPGASTDPLLAATVRFTSDSGDYDWELRNDVGALVASGSGTWAAGVPIVVNDASLRLGGVPAAGDIIEVTATRSVDVASNNGNARALAALRDGAFVGGQTITEAYASLMAGVGVRVQGARTAAEISAGVAEAAEQQRAAKSGVNLDEEAARLIQFQQAYQAAAKVLQVAQSVFDTLLSTAAR